MWNQRKIPEIALSTMVTVVRRVFSMWSSHSVGVEYWQKRVKKFGARSVLNLGHLDGDYEATTERQKAEIYPHLQKLLLGNERLVLDFGCGPGRFTGDLAAMIKGNAIGLDPIPQLLAMAPQNKNVEFRGMEEGVIPLPDNSVDVTWICLVLGGIRGESLDRTIKEIDRVMNAEALLFLVENTSEKEEGDYWVFRQFEEYKRLFSHVRLVHLHDYDDLGERISIMAGRK